MSKIIALSVCKEKLSEEEFVRPVVEILEGTSSDVEVLNIYKQNVELPRKSKLVICGTALKDFDYLNFDFSWIKNCESVLGICAGYQIIAKTFSISLEKIEKIGVYEVKCIKKNPLINGNFKAYFLHKLSIRLNEHLNERSKIEVLAIQGDEIAAFKVRNRNCYALSFHPEVLNPEIFYNFLNL